MRKVIRVITDKLDVETAITLDPNGEVMEISEGCLPIGAIDPLWDILDGLDLRNVEDINIRFQGDDAELNFDPVGDLYRWATPHQWLGYYASSLEMLGDVAGLARLVATLAPLVDPDEIQHALQSQMSVNGYYVKLHPVCTNCKEVSPLYLAPNGQLCSRCKGLLDTVNEIVDSHARQVLDE